MRQAIRPISIVRDSHWPELLRQGLREAGYVEGLNLAIEWRDAEGKTERFGDLAAELVRLKVDVIVAANPAATFAAKRSTASIPIVMDYL
jgi:putative ABC transport system substrate-binding protein